MEQGKAIRKNGGRRNRGVKNIKGKKGKDRRRRKLEVDMEEDANRQGGKGLEGKRGRGERAQVRGPQLFFMPAPACTQHRIRVLFKEKT